MADFGIILCSENEDNGRENTLNLITHKIKSVFKGKKFEFKVDQVELYKNLNMFVIKLQDSPQSLAELKEKHLKDILKSISDICIKNSIKHCIIPEFLPDRLITDQCIKKKFSGQYLYMALMWNIIHKLLNNYKKDIEDIEVAIISGDSQEKLKAVISLLLSKIKYLTIITENKDLISENINKIYQETGLSIRLATDGKNAFKDIDLIINLNKFYEFKSSYKPKENTIIINYSDSILNWASIENIIINKINIGMPPNLINKIEPNLLKSFNSLELSEIILCHKENIDDEILKSLYACDNMRNIAKSFDADGYTIDGFFGRRGFLKK